MDSSDNSNTVQNQNEEREVLISLNEPVLGNVSSNNEKCTCNQPAPQLADDNEESSGNRQNSPSDIARINSLREMADAGAFSTAELQFIASCGHSTYEGNNSKYKKAEADLNLLKQDLIAAKVLPLNNGDGNDNEGGDNGKDVAMLNLVSHILSNTKNTSNNPDDIATRTLNQFFAPILSAILRSGSQNSNPTSD